MRYLSTRSATAAASGRKRFCEILLEGLAPDGGLYLPESYPQLDALALEKLGVSYREHGYAELAFAILSLYIDDIPAPDLHAICLKTYTQEVFGTPEIVPLTKLEAGRGPVPGGSLQWPDTGFQRHGDATARQFV